MIRTPISKAFMLAFAFFATFVAPKPTMAADDIVCAGNNLLTQLAGTNAGLLREIENKAGQLPYGKGLLWQVTPASGASAAPSYIYGTMHMSDPRLLDLSPAVSKAFTESNVLALEVTDIVDPEAMKAKMQGMVKYTAYLDGSTISDRMNDEQEAIMRKTFGERSSIPWFLAKRLKPWALMGAIAAPACETARKAAGKPFLDLSLAQQAQKAGKQLVALETLESQIKIMSSLPEPLMVKALYETALLGNRLDDVFETMIALYEEERIGMIWAMMKYIGPKGIQKREDVAGYADFQNEVVDKRNKTMADSSEALIKKGGAFIAVGALHLPGDNGLLNILAQRGYQISPK